MITNNENKIAPIAQRIEKAKAHKAEGSGIKLSWSRLAQEIGLTVTAPNNWKNGKISNETVEAIAQYTGTNTEWLKTGEGTMLPADFYLHLEIPFDTKDHDTSKVYEYAQSYIDKNFEQIFRPFGVTRRDDNFKIINMKGDKIILERTYSTPDLFIKNIKESGIYAVVNVKVLNNIMYLDIINRKFDLESHNSNNDIENTFAIENTSSPGKRIPIISYIQAGAFKEAIQEKQDEYIVSRLNNLSDYSFGLTVRGNSMTPDFKEGDRIVVDPKIYPHPGDFVIAQNGGYEATFKKFRPRGFDENGREYFELVPLNEEYPTMDSRFQDIEIIGTVVEHIRALRRI